MQTCLSASLHQGQRSRVMPLRERREYVRTSLFARVPQRRNAVPLRGNRKVRMFFGLGEINSKAATTPPWEACWQANGLSDPRIRLQASFPQPLRSPFRGSGRRCWSPKCRGSLEAGQYGGLPGPCLTGTSNQESTGMYSRRSRKASVLTRPPDGAPQSGYSTMNPKNTCIGERQKLYRR